jgi:hypothetical protein
MFRSPVGMRMQVLDYGPAVMVFKNIRANVTHASGPWCSDHEWWSARGSGQREEWDVELAVSGEKRIYRVFKEVQTGKWFVQGMYD